MPDLLVDVLLEVLRDGRGNGVAARELERAVRAVSISGTLARTIPCIVARYSG